ncbi:hypothetical protein HY630_03290 [Candidatus Uhrbacteria bacterium]|nr:hypothetical protein [Candidatus Uhrbacteria bacterium]
MNLGDRSIPLLVVPGGVSSIEEALEAATCQVCLGKTGSPDRGLYRVLKDLGAEDLDSAITPASRGAVVVASRDEQPTRQRGAVVVQSGRPREVAIFDPLLGTSLVLPTRVRDRRGPPLHAGRPPSSEPRLPRAPREVGHLTGAISKSRDNAAVLEAVRAGIEERAQERRRQRAEAFEKLIFYLRLTLARIRKNAATSEVWERMETFVAKLDEAVSLDAQRDRKGILQTLGTSEAELVALCLMVYQKPSTWVWKPGSMSETIDAFEGGRRPEHWDEKGGRKPRFYAVEVLRSNSSFPVPNPPLPGGDEDPRPRVIYPEGQKYGPDYEVQNSQSEHHQFDWELRPFGWAVIGLTSWMDQCPDLELVCNGSKFNLPDLLCWFVEPVLDEEEEQSDVIIDDQTTALELTTISLDFPAIT